MASDEEIDPWARGGSMSVGWVDPGSRSIAGEHTVEPPDSPDTSRPVRRIGPGAAIPVALVLVGVVAVGWRAASTSVTGMTETTLGVVSALGDGGSTVVSGATSIDTIVGPISWTRVDGDSATLPGRVTRSDTGDLLGVDGDGGRWRSDDAGASWFTVDRVYTDREVGGTTWSSRTVAGTTSLWWTDGHAVTREVEFDVAGDADLVGYELIIDRPDDRFPTAFGDDVYLPVTVRATLPWSLIAGGLSESPYRFRIDVDGHEFRAAAGEVDGLEIVDLTVQPVDDERVGLVGDDGHLEWSFAAPDGHLVERVSNAVAGVPTTVWTRWTGERFVRVEEPWTVGDRVEFATVDGAMWVRVSAPGRRPSIWRTVDGEQWDEVPLPAEPSADTPLNVRQGDDEVIVTAFTERGAISWVTEHDAKFQELLPIPGIEARAKGSFGWVAPSPRSAPRLHVSPDGETWESIDLRELLDLDSSHWSVRIDVTPIGDHIYVVADRPEARTLLIGTVGPSG